MQVESVSAINGTVTVTLAEAVETIEGVTFTVTQTIGEGEATAVEATNPVLSEDGLTVTLTVTAVPATEADQSVVYTVNTVAAPAFVVEALAPDNEIPVITVDTELAIDVAFGGEFTLPVATVTDNVSEGLVATSVITNEDGEEIEAIDTRVPGVYTIAFDTVDAAGNAADTLEVTVTVAEPFAIETVTPVTTSSIEVDLTTEDLTADNFVVTYLPTGKTADADVVTVEITSVTPILDETTEDLLGYSIVTEDLTDVSGILAVNGTEVAFNYTAEGLAEALEDVNDGKEGTKALADALAVAEKALADSQAADKTSLQTAVTNAENALNDKVDAVYATLEAPVLNLADTLNEDLKLEYALEIEAGLTNTYERLLAALERVVAGVEEATNKKLEAVNKLDITSNEAAIKAALADAGATVLDSLIVTYFDEIEAIEFTSLDEVVETIDDINVTELEAAVKAVENATKSSTLNATAIETSKELIGDATTLIGEYATAYDLETVTDDLAEGDDATAATATDRVAVATAKVELQEDRVAVLTTADEAKAAKDAVAKAGEDVTSEQTAAVTTTKSAFTTALTALYDNELATALDKEVLVLAVVDGEVSQDDVDAHVAEYITKVAALTDNATLPNIQSAVVAANTAVKTTAAKADVNTVFAQFTVTEKVAALAEGKDAASLAAALNKVVDSEVVTAVAANDAYYLPELAKLDKTKATAADIQAAVVAAHEAKSKELLTVVIKTAKNTLDEKLEADAIPGALNTALGNLVSDINDIKVITSEEIDAANNATYVKAIAALANTATVADVVAAVKEVNLLAALNAEITSKGETTTTLNKFAVDNNITEYRNVSSTAKADVAAILYTFAPKAVDADGEETTTVEFKASADVIPAIKEAVAQQAVLLKAINDATTYADFVDAIAAGALAVGAIEEDGLADFKVEYEAAAEGLQDAKSGEAYTPFKSIDAILTALGLGA